MYTAPMKKMTATLPRQCQEDKGHLQLCCGASFLYAQKTWNSDSQAWNALQSFRISDFLYNLFNTNLSKTFLWPLIHKNSKLGLKDCIIKRMQIKQNQIAITHLNHCTCLQTLWNLFSYSNCQLQSHPLQVNQKGHCPCRECLYRYHIPL